MLIELVPVKVYFQKGIYYERITRNDDITEAQIIKRFPFLSKTAGKT